MAKKARKAKKKTAKKARKGAKKKKKTSKAARSRAADRALVSGKQRHEVSYLARKHGVSSAAVRDAIKKVGNSRKKVEAELSK